jgi:hypothetical protein
MIVYTFNFINAEFDQNSELEKVIKKLHWQLVGTEDGETVAVPFITELDDPVVESFVQFQDLVIDQLIAWVSDKIDVNFIKKNIQEELLRLKAFKSIESINYSSAE